MPANEKNDIKNRERRKGLKYIQAGFIVDRYLHAKLRITIRLPKI